MRIPIVDESDNIINYKDINDRKPDDIYRVSSLWVTNSKGDILLAKRALRMKRDPGKWGAAVAGTLEDDETYEENIIREAEEELGLKNIKPTLGLKLRKKEEWGFFVQRFDIVIDKDISEFEIQEEEVAEIKWFTKEQLKKELTEHPDDFLKSIHDRMKE
ncbi:MAG: NUDIX domain-containing protein [Candidatus Paceibacterota bacterium]|jgi:isopentenyl-diphosphate delta-isomerase